jgi:hypothetical protein
MLSSVAAGGVVGKFSVERFLKDRQENGQSFDCVNFSSCARSSEMHGVGGVTVGLLLEEGVREGSKLS